MAASDSAPGDVEVGRIFREESGRSVATLVRVFGDIDLAEDAVQEAFAVALRRWRTDGVPPSPGAWITTTARRRAIDRLRRERRGRELLDAVGVEPVGVPDLPEGESSVPDDRLRLFFTCCHPALAPEAQVALTLRLLGGLATAEVARALLVSETSMAQRLVRAKRKIRVARIPYRVPGADELPERLPPVLAAVYLVYTAGAAEPPAADDLCVEALRLARILAASMPTEPEVDGLLALLLLTQARRPARFAADGSLVLLRDQDRSRWDRSAIREGRSLVRRCLARGRPGPYQIQAAIGAVHADAASIEVTDWRQIVLLYDQMMIVAPTPVVALNRAVAIGEVDGAAAALDAIESLELDRYAPYHATRADLLLRLGRTDDARAAYRRAASLSPAGPERDFLSERGRDEDPP